MNAHVGESRNYYVAFAALMALTATTVFVAYVDLGMASLPLALAIATAKATIVVVYFMHVRQGGPLIALFWLVGLAWALLLISLTLMDVASRDWLPAPKGWTRQHETAPRTAPAYAPHTTIETTGGGPFNVDEGTEMERNLGFRETTPPVREHTSTSSIRSQS